eukprot:jgi/Orpsp1_1/1191998/evm.model.d7180000089913.1
MKERDNKPQYPVTFERRQEIYGYSGQTQRTRDIIFSDYNYSVKSNENNIISSINNSENKDLIDSIHQDDKNNEITNKIGKDNNNLETYVCVGDEGSCSSIVWKCNWENNYSLAHHSLYQQLPSENYSPILDIKFCPIYNTHSYLLACLTKNQIFLYKK